MSGRTLTVRLPFYCEPILDQHRFGGLVENAFIVEGGKLIDGLTIKTELLQKIRLVQSWDNDEVINQAKEPYVSLTITIERGPTPSELVWYWRGDGEYDGFSINGDKQGWLQQPPEA